MFKKSAQYFTLALALVALTATVRTAHAQATDPCSDPSNPCVVGGTDPQPGAQVVGGTDPQPGGQADGTDDSQSMDDLISYLMIVYGMA